MHLKSNPKMELVVSLADLDLMQMETPIPSSKQNLEMESSQTKKISSCQVRATWPAVAA